MLNCGVSAPASYNCFGFPGEPNLFEDLIVVVRFCL